MKTPVVAAVSLLAGLAIGCGIGYRYNEMHTTNAAIQAMVEGMESASAFEAVINIRAIGLIDSGQTQQAVQMLSVPITRYYYVYASSAFTNEQRLKLRALIDGLASTNQTVAAQIAEQISDKKK